MEYKDVYEIAEKYTQLANEVKYPISFKKPLRDQYKDVVDYNKGLAAYEEHFHNDFIPAKKEYRATQERITQSFKRDLLEFLGVSDHPKAETLWVMAWDRGHSNGYNEVAMEAENLAELL